MSCRCKHENCFPDTTCALGYVNREDCEHWQEENSIAEEEVKKIETPVSDIPWNGYALGTSDMVIVGGRGQPFVIGLMGPPDSGKTSLLAFLYMWLLKHGHFGDWRFAGSWTLGGWESVIQHCRWIGEPPPSFPPHTSSTGRHPGILHLLLRHQLTGEARDVLLTDAPGEWFTQWARSPGEPSAVGARWVIEHSDVLLVLVDSEALANTEKLPQTRRATRDLIERVGAEAKHRNIIMVWTKDDIKIPEATRIAVSRSCGEFLPDAIPLKTTVATPETIAACFARAIRQAENTRVSLNNVEPRLSHDPFLAYRGWHVIT